MTHRRGTILVGGVVAALAVAAVWSTHRMTEQRGIAHQTAQDLVQCQEHARAIESLRKKPTVASAEAMGVQELGKRIESASRRAQLPAASLEGVFPQRERRVGNSPYLHKPTVLALRDVSLLQTATFLYYLTDGSGLTVSELRLRSPHGEAADDRWDADATLTYLVYAPSSQTSPTR
jgi:hypothetical protein